MSAKLGSDQSEFNNYYANIALRKTFFPYAKQILLLVTKGLLAEFYSTILRWARIDSIDRSSACSFFCHCVHYSFRRITFKREMCFSLVTVQEGALTPPCAVS